jgi:hypothetical protein
MIQCGIDQELVNGLHMTTFVPTNSAWQQMNFTDVVYLFSPLGIKDLKKILQYHVLWIKLCALTFLVFDRFAPKSNMDKT